MIISSNSNMKKIAIILFLLSSFHGWSQDKKPVMTWKDVASWKAIPAFGGTQLSPDGAWFAYVLAPNEGDAELILRKTGDTLQKNYALGSSGSFNFTFSENSGWFAFRVYPKDKDKKAAAKTPGGKPLTEKLVLVNLSDFKKTEFDKVKSYAFNGEKASALAIHLTGAVPAGRPAPGIETPRGSDLLLLDLASTKVQNIGNVADFAFNKSGEWLAFTIDAAEKAGNGVLLRNMNSGLTHVADNGKASYKSVNWTEQGDGLALLKGIKDEKFKEDLYSVIAVRNFAGSPEVIVFEPAKDTLDFPKGMTVSANRTPFLSDDLTAVFFGISKAEPVKKDTKKPEAAKTLSKTEEQEKLNTIKADTSIRTLEDLSKALAKAKQDTTKKAEPSPDREKPEMAIWHWQDKRLQSRQEVQERADKSFSHLAVYYPERKKFVRLADSLVRNISLTPKQVFGIGQDISSYELDINLDGQQYADIYVVDPATGKKERVLEKHYLPNFWASPNASPDGQKFLFWSDGRWMIYDLKEKSAKAIAGANTSFINIEDDHNVRKPPYSVFGWTSDSRSVLVSDGWDVWQLPADGISVPVNLTRNGKSGQIRYQTRFVLDPEEKGIDLSKPQYFRTYGEWTKKSGVSQLESGTVKPLLWEDLSIGGLSKARKTDAYVFSRQSFVQAPEYFRSQSASLDQPVQLTRNAPEFSKYAWSPSVRLIDYKSDKGDKLQGALFLPAGYEAGKKYPTIVYYYEKLSQTLHNFANPSYSGSGWNPSVYTSNGYAVFIPDIVYKLNDPGMSAVWCVIPGVKAALKTGIIDESRIGIHGHSWGGYQTSFLITQTQMFKAAAAGAPLTDMVSMYGLIYKNTGSTNGSIFEASQGRLGAPWENWEAYNRNSPLYHVKKVNTPLLMLHNDADGAVDFTQGIEYFNALRRLKKPVILVQYKGENHGLAKLPNRKDYAVRMMEFFDFHLKGKPAPDWMAKGIDRLNLDDHLENRLMIED